MIPRCTGTRLDPMLGLVQLEEIATLARASLLGDNMIKDRGNLLRSYEQCFIGEPRACSETSPNSILQWQDPIS